jgi:quercetin dioxygenase-like cupin family protein
MTSKKNSLLDPAIAGTCSLLIPTEKVAHGIISRAVLTTLTLRVTLFDFGAGQELSEHTSKARALVQVLSGGCVFTVAGCAHTMQAGDLLHLPPGMPHAVLATGPFSMLLTQVTEPVA